VRALLLLLGALSLMGGSIESRIQAILGPRLYSDNLPVIKTLVGTQAVGGDLLSTLRLLEKVGILPENYRSPREQRITFISPQAPYLLMKLSRASLHRAALYGVHLESLERGELFRERLLFRSSQTPRLSRIVEFLEENGGVVRDIRREGSQGGWQISVDLRNARIPAKRVVGEAHLSIRKELWIDVAGQRRAEIAVSGGWYPDIALYDRWLRPLASLKSEEMRKGIEITLPKGTRYMRITDRFTPKNLKRGIYLRLQ